MGILLGLIFISLGFLVKAFPDLISGYNTMTKEQKENVDIEGLSSLMKNSFIAIGLTIIVGYYFFNWIGFPLVANSMILISILGGMIIMILKSRKYNRNESNNRSTKATYAILIIISLFIFGMLYHDTRPTKIIITKESILIKGTYGLEIPIKDIQEVKLVKKIPTITLRTNGFGFGPIKKGNFNLEEYGNCKLFLYSDSNPYLIITDKNGKKIIINHDNKEKTEMEFKKLKLLITNR